MTPVNTPYCGPAPLAAELWISWNMDWRLWLVLLLMLPLALRVKRRGAYLAAWAGLVIAFVSPLCALTVALFSARTAHHLLLLCAVAPLLAMNMRHPRWRLPPLFLSLSLTAILVLWHIPAVYALAWENHAVYWALQIALLGVASLFWAAIHELSLRQTAASLTALAGVTMSMGLIGAVLTFAPRVLYPEHMTVTMYYGFSPLSDQQLAGLLMWVPGFLPFAFAAGKIAKRVFVNEQAARNWA